MKRGWALLFSALMVLTFAACRKSPPPVQAAAPPEDTEVEAAQSLIADYLTWPRINKEAVRMADVVLTLCVGPGPAHDADNPHMEKYIVVHGNPAAEKALRGEWPYKFPEGAVIVKQKLPEKDSTEPELLTIMVKGEAGSRPEFGDWKFFTASGDGKVDAERKDKECFSCHEKQAESDYVFGSYVNF